VPMPPKRHSFLAHHRQGYKPTISRSRRYTHVPAPHRRVRGWLVRSTCGDVWLEESSAALAQRCLLPSSVLHQAHSTRVRKSPLAPSAKPLGLGGRKCPRSPESYPCRHPSVCGELEASLRLHGHFQLDPTRAALRRAWPLDQASSGVHASEETQLPCPPQTRIKANDLSIAAKHSRTSPSQAGAWMVSPQHAW